MTPDIVAALTPLAEALERLGVRYQVGGSVASSFHGEPRATLDVDLVADIQRSHVAPLVEALEASYYIDLDAVVRRASFNAIHLATVLKIDVFVLKGRAFDREAMNRGEPGVFGEGREFTVASVEDTVLHKLEWFRLGGGVSERQWRDVLGVMRAQRGALDLDCLERQAATIGVSELLDMALGEAAGP